jgi:hypothetical protein
MVTINPEQPKGIKVQPKSNGATKAIPEAQPKAAIKAVVRKPFTKAEQLKSNKK